MKLLEELKEVVEVRVDIKEDILAEKLYDKAVMPLLEKVVDLIPTEIDNAFLEANKEKLKESFFELINEGVSEAEARVDEVLGNE